MWSASCWPWLCPSNPDTSASKSSATCRPHTETASRGRRPHEGQSAFHFHKLVQRDEDHAFLLSLLQEHEGRDRKFKNGCCCCCPGCGVIIQKQAEETLTSDRKQAPKPGCSSTGTALKLRGRRTPAAPRGVRDSNRHLGSYNSQTWIIITTFLQSCTLEDGAAADSMDTTTSIKMTTLAIQNLFSYNGQTPLMLAAEQGSLEIVQELIRRGANVNLDDVDCWSALISAAKEGHLEVVKELLENSAYIEHRDMGGWTALMWAAYKGQVDVTELLLENGANPNTTGQQYSVYPIIWAAGRGHADIVKVLLETGAKVNCSDKRNPNVNMTDKDGNTALMIAAKEGFTEIVQDLLDAGTYVNIPDRSGDTVLIGAVRGGHVEIVRALLHKYADIDIRGQRGDTPLHIAIRGRSRRLAELLLRNPKDGRLLYRPNKGGETPYNIDCSHQKSILTQIFGARTSPVPPETDGDMLGYDLYSSALADILSEPTMQPPICVGLYAQWGSGKSFLLKKLEDEMKTFAGQQIDPLFSFSWLVVFLSLMFCSSVALVLGFTVDPKLALAVSLSLLALLYLFFVVVFFGGRRQGDSWTWVWLLSTRLARQLGYLQLLLRLMFRTLHHYQSRAPEPCPSGFCSRTITAVERRGGNIDG
ncbi:hypothetical protein F7725_028368 [Dissostichus mawsoni]|uniref:KAP NTPase domain-containing protein n=1 Tax=Dissostichus mawsoni TaxID=36200 RepID=A0A7J5XFT7_DISMA|nr:hypothetical protein F7725_028368 [Dissostichus mawsoni]